jgi:hypothetical protein
MHRGPKESPDVPACGSRDPEETPTPGTEGRKLPPPRLSPNNGKTCADPHRRAGDLSMAKMHGLRYYCRRRPVDPPLVAASEGVGGIRVFASSACGGGPSLGQRAASLPPPFNA